MGKIQRYSRSRKPILYVSKRYSSPLCRLRQTKKPKSIMVEVSTTQTEKILYKGKIKLPKPDKNDWYVYVLQTKRNTLYTGVTNDLLKRMKTHEDGKGSKYVKAYGFKQLLRFKKCKTKSDAHKAEYQIKQLLSQSQKLSWFTQNK